MARVLPSGPVIVLTTDPKVDLTPKVYIPRSHQRSAKVGEGLLGSAFPWKTVSEAKFLFAPAL